MEETSGDISFFKAPSYLRNNEDRRRENNNEHQIEPHLKFDPNAAYYNMNGDKHLIIFNHHTYKKTRYFRNTQPATRNGTFEDVKSLTNVFEKLKFNVTVHKDLDHKQIIDEVSQICSQDHSRTSCIIVAILTHGDQGGDVYAADRPYRLNDVLSMFQSGHHTLVGKPKLFIIQACRGGNMDDGRRVQLDGESYINIPTHADFLVLHSSVEDYLSYRDSNGSWMIQAFCKVLEEHHEDLDILHIVTLVNRMVAYERNTFTPKCQETNNKKQMTEARFTLTKLFKFN